MFRKRIRNIPIDFDGTLHDTESVFASKLNGLFGMDGRKLYHAYLYEIHRKIIHEQYPHRHEDMNFQWRLLLRHLGEPFEGEKVDLLNFSFEEANKSMLENSRICRDVQPFLNRVVKTGLRLCLSTGGYKFLEKSGGFNLRPRHKLLRQDY